MAQPKVELRKTRDFSQNLNDTFEFIKQNFKPLVTSFFLIAGIFMLANSIVSGLYQSRMSNIFRDISTGGESFSPFEMWSRIGGFQFVWPLTWLNLTAMQVAIVSYIKAYELRGGEWPEINDVWNIFKQYYVKLLFYNIVILLLIFAGFIFCLLPGIYFFVVFAPFAIVVVLEDKSFGEAFSRCFELIRDNFWSSFGIYILVYLIYSLGGGILSAIIAGISGLLSYFTTGNLGTTVGLVTSVLSIFSFVFYIIYYVSVSLHYYNLVEKTDGTGILQRLDKLGDSTNDFNNTKEQY